MLPDKNIRILLIEDDEIDAESVMRQLGKQATTFVTTHVGCLTDALRCVKDNVFHIVLLDLGLPDSTDLEGVIRLRKEAPYLPIMVLTGLDDQNRASEAVQAGAQDYLIKGKINQDVLVRAIGYAIERQKIQNESIKNLEALEASEFRLAELNVTLEKRVESRTQALAETNRELETFAYSVSHDLQAPLRSVDGFSAILLEDYETNLPEEGKDYLRRVRAGAVRMKRLIDDMLNFSRQTRGTLTKESVDLSVIAEEIIEDFKAQSPDRKVEIQISNPLIVDADKGMMRVVLENLLGNAWKFTQGVSPVQITVGRDAKKSHCIFVQDNGAGFDIAHTDSLFAPFKRLHTEEEFPGTGIGLATVKRIISRHGGQIWAESGVGEGATFYFTL